MRKGKIRSIVSLLSAFVVFTGLFSIALTPVSAETTPISVDFGKEMVADGTLNAFQFVFDSTTDYFSNGKAEIYNAYYPSVWPDQTNPMLPSFQNKLSIQIGDTVKTMAEFGGGSPDTFVSTIKVDGEFGGKWVVRMMTSQSNGQWMDPATQKVIVRFHEGFQMPDGTSVAPTTFTREAGAAIGSGTWVKSAGATALPTSVRELQGPDYVNNSPPFLFTMRMILQSTWNADMKALGAEIDTVQHENNPNTPAAVTAAVNDCILINGKTVREINTAAGKPNTVLVRMNQWAIDPANPSQNYWFLIDPSINEVTDVSAAKGFTFQVLEGMVDFLGAPITPISKRWVPTENKFVDFDPTQTVAAQTAAAITTLQAPVNGDVKLTMPTVPDGCSVVIKSSSDTSAVALDGTITQKAEPSLARLVLTVTDGDGHSADTVSISVTIPRITVETTRAQEAADAITGFSFITYHDTKVAMPTVPAGCTVAIKSSDNAVIAIDGTISKSAEGSQTASLVLTVTDEDGNTADTLPLSVKVPKLITDEGAVDLLAVNPPDYTSFSQWGLLFGLRLVMNTTYVDKDMVADAVQWPDFPQRNPRITDEFRMGINDCILINGKSIRQINKESNSNTMINVQVDGWGPNMAVHFYPGASMDPNYMNLTEGQDFTVSTLQGLVDWNGVPQKPMQKKWIAKDKMYVDVYSASEAAKKTTALVAPGTGITALELPKVGGCTVQIKSSSNPGVVKLDGSIVMPEEATDVVLVLTYTDETGATADTAPITVSIPKKGEPPITDVSFDKEYMESDFSILQFRFNTSNDYGIDNIYNGLQYFDNHELVWLPAIDKPVFRKSIADLIKIKVGDGEEKTISQWGLEWHLAFYVDDGQWVMRFHYAGDDAAIKEWPTKNITVAFLKGFMFPDGTMLNPMKFQRKAAAIEEGDVTILEGAYTAAYVASKITDFDIEEPVKGDTKLVFPTVEEGYSIKLSYSSDEKVIALDGTLTPAEKTKYVSVRFTITRLSDNTSAETEEFSIMVPKSSGEPDSSTEEQPGDDENSTTEESPDNVGTGESRMAVAVCMMLSVLAAGAVILGKKRQQE